LQIFVRPHTVDLEPNIQFKEIGTPPLNEWRLLAGPEDTEAPSFIRNDVHLYDALSMRMGTEWGSPLELTGDVHAWRSKAGHETQILYILAKGDEIVADDLDRARRHRWQDRKARRRHRALYLPRR
jgi:hypothetical protein